MKTINVYLLRHGKTEGEPALNGQTDVLVASERQIEIAQRLLKRGIGFSHIYSSPLHRCADLTDYLAEHLRDAQIGINSALSEMDFGDFDGRPFSSLQEHEWKQLEQFWQQPAQTQLPNGEKLEDFYYRCVRAWKNMITEMGESTLVIAHGGTIRMILAYLLELDWKNPRWITHLAIDNQSLTHVQIMFGAEEPHFVVKSIGVTL